MLGDRRDLGPDGISGFPQIIHECLKFWNQAGTCGEERIGTDHIPALERHVDRPQLAEIAADQDPVSLTQPLPCDRRSRHSDGGFSG